MGATYAAVAAKISDLLAVESTLTERANRIVHTVIKPSLADGLLMEYKDIMAPTRSRPAISTLTMPTALTIRDSGR